MELSRSWDAAVAQILKNFQIFYATQTFITVFIKAIHWSLSWARLWQSTPAHFFCNIQKVQYMKLFIMQFFLNVLLFNKPSVQIFSSVRSSVITSIHVLRLMSEVKFHTHIQIHTPNYSQNYSFVYLNFYAFRRKTRRQKFWTER
jgi:hypothetical protein